MSAPTTTEKQEADTPIGGDVEEAFEDAETVLGATKPGDDALGEDDVPTALRGAIEDLNAAIDESRVPAQFPESTTYPAAEQPAAIARVLIGYLDRHAHLRSVLEAGGITFRFRQTLRKDGETKGGKVLTVGPTWKAISGLDFRVEFNYDVWPELSRRDRVRLVDHELCHCAEDEDGELTSGTHDIEEFVPILRDWGPARGQKRAAEAIQQAELFAGDGEA